MRFQATPEFFERYEVLDDETAACVDEALQRLLVEHAGAWARQNRVVGDHGAAWLIAVRCRAGDFALYWRESDDDTIVLVLLLRN